MLKSEGSPVFFAPKCRFDSKITVIEMVLQFEAALNWMLHMEWAGIELIEVLI
jgi:hypothetical protein